MADLASERLQQPGSVGAETALEFIQARRCAVQAAGRGGSRDSTQQPPVPAAVRVKLGVAWPRHRPHPSHQKKSRGEGWKIPVVGDEGQ